MFLERAFDAVAVIRGDAEEYGMHHRIGAKYFRLERFYALGQIDVVEIPPHKRIETVAVVEKNSVARQLGGVFDRENPALGQFRAIHVGEFFRGKRLAFRYDRLVPGRKPAAAEPFFEIHVDAVYAAHLSFAPDVDVFTVAHRRAFSGCKRLRRRKRMRFRAGGPHFYAQRPGGRIDAVAKRDFRSERFDEMVFEIVRREADIVRSRAFDHDRRRPARSRRRIIRRYRRDRKDKKKEKEFIKHFHA